MESYTYQETLTAAERVNWRVEDIIGGDRRLDFTKPFIPEPLARVEQLSFLTPHERRTLNQIRGNAYLCIFAIVEEFILPFVLDHARPRLGGDDHRVRALLQFAGEEAKHIHLFNCFKHEFERGFRTPCQVIGPGDTLARRVLSHDPLAVAIAILHIEWMTQRHYIDSVRDDRDLDPQFASLLKHHWMEEAQHAKLDTLMIEALAERRTEAEILSAVEEYLKIAELLDSGLMQQVELDLQSFVRATGRRLSDAEQSAMRSVQRHANRWTYLGSGMTHPKLLATLERLGPSARARVEGVAPVFS